MAFIGKTREPSYFYHADPRTIEFAKWLRKRMTASEKMLWERLRRHNIQGVKFRRQHPIEYYVADFYCHEIKMVIEVDGPVHARPDQKEHDENRSAEMDRFGIKVIRFTNDEVKNHIGRVMKTIRKEIKQRLAKYGNQIYQVKTLPPLQGEGRGGVIPQ
jgi:very-short-patch-repair endonuclease